MVPKIIFTICIFLVVSCGTKQNDDLRIAEIRNEINDTRTRFWSNAMTGNLDSMISYHLSSPEYRLYENGKFYDYKAQADGHKNMDKQGISSIKFNVQVTDSVILNREYAFETWNGTTVTSYNSGKIDTSDRFIVTILYKKENDRWKFSYLHSSSQTDQNK